MTRLVQVGQQANGAKERRDQRPGHPDRPSSRGATRQGTHHPEQRSCYQHSPSPHGPLDSSVWTGSAIGCPEDLEQELVYLASADQLDARIVCVHPKHDHRVEGWQYLNPNIDYSNWEKPEAASQATLWLATRDPSYTGQVVTITETRQQMAAGA